MNFLPQLLSQYRNILAFPGAAKGVDRLSFEALLYHLENPECKRLLFDARQAAVFDEVGPFDEQRKPKIHAPFEFFYLEFTEPVLLHSKEPGYTDLLRGFLYGHQLDEVTECLASGVKKQTKVHRITFFFKSDQDQFVDRTWSVTEDGYPLIGRQKSSILKQRTRKEIEVLGKEGDGSFVHEANIPDWVGEGEFCSASLSLKKDWWEQSIQSFTDLVFWIFAYSMAKSVRIVEVPVTRQVRRAMEREQKIPKPWHVVRVEPKFSQGKAETVGEGTPHSYRYDVIGHLRFNKHKTKTGSYKETVEWVSDHQRGVENELYIPKTYSIEAGKKIDVERMKKYANE